MVKKYIEPEIRINKFECEKVEVTASRVMRQWQNDTDNAQVRSIDYSQLKIFN